MSQISQTYPVYYFCESYVQLENLLFLAEQYGAQHVVVTVVFDRNLFRQISQINEANLAGKLQVRFVWRRYTNKKSTNVADYFLSVRNSFRQFCHVRKIYRKTFKNVVGKDIYFSCRFFNAYTFYFIKRLRSRNRVIYIPPDNNEELQPLRPQGRTFRDRLASFRLKLVFGPGIGFYVFKVKKMPYITDRFMKRLDRLTPQEERRSLVHSAILFHKFKPSTLKSYKVVVVDSPLQRDGAIPSDLLDAELRNVFAVLSRYYVKDQIGIKYHPGDPPLCRYPTDAGETVPSYVMGQFLAFDHPEILLGFTSAVLFDNNAKRNISLIDLLSIEPKEMAQMRKKYLLERASVPISFPKDILEFEELVRALKLQDGWKERQDSGIV